MVESIDELIQLIDDWNWNHHPLKNELTKNGNKNNNKNENESKNNNNNNNVTELQSLNNEFDLGFIDSNVHIGKRPDGRHKKRSHANAMSDQIRFDETPAKKSRLIV